MKHDPGASSLHCGMTVPGNTGMISVTASHKLAPRRHNI